MATDRPSDVAPGREEAVSLVSEMRGTHAGLILLAGIGTLNIGNAAFHLLTARVLGPSQYSEVASLVTVAGLISLPFSGVQVAIARFVAEDATRGEAGALASFVRRAMLASVIVAGALAAALTLVSPVVRNALGVRHLTPVVLTALYVFPALLAPALWGVAQGLQRFALISVSMVSGTAFRIGIVVALLPFGLGVGGVMGATLLSGFAALAVPMPLVWRWLRRTADPSAARTHSDRAVVGYVIPVMAGTLAITSLTSVDLIAAKVALTSHDAGIYGSASFIGRLLLYLPTTIATVLLPKVTSRAVAARDTREILHASLAVTALFSLGATAILITLPHLVVDVTFGSSYGSAAPLVGLFGLAMTLYALLNILLVYHLGHGRPGVAWLLLGGAIVQIAIYGAVHGSAYQLITANLASAGCLLLIHELAFEATLVPGSKWLVVTLHDRLIETRRQQRG